MSATGDGLTGVRILDKEYLIACPPEERADLQRAATLLNARLRETREGGKAIGTERVLMMAALNMANELAKLQAREERVTADFGSRVKAMRERVERALVQGQQLEL
ncbi:MAG TPA: cell division protein ZapA [Steroidobacteraceae bacterium]|nr:cell division protein ZapA [Steroidobacteraceae bacterium]